MQIAAICKSSFYVRNIALTFIWWSVWTLLVREDSIIVFRYYVSKKKLNYKNGLKLFDTCYSEREKIWPHDTNVEVNVYLLPNNFSVLSHFQVFLLAEMHILIFLAVVLFAPPCADSLWSGKWYNLFFRFLSFENSSDYKKTTDRKKILKYF